MINEGTASDVPAFDQRLRLDEPRTFKQAGEVRDGGYLVAARREGRGCCDCFGELTREVSEEKRG